MRFIDRTRFAPLACLAAAAIVAACSTSGGPPDPRSGETIAPTVPQPAPPPSPGVAAASRSVPPAEPVASWAAVRQQAAQRLMTANPDRVYAGTAPDPLLAIPVLEVELNGDGSIRRIEVLRAPRQAKDTVQLAVDALYRAAPFGNVSRLPRPWKFVETFLFDDDRKFKPRSLER